MTDCEHKSFYWSDSECVACGMHAGCIISEQQDIIAELSAELADSNNRHQQLITTAMPEEMAIWDVRKEAQAVVEVYHRPLLSLKPFSDEEIEHQIMAMLEAVGALQDVLDGPKS